MTVKSAISMDDSLMERVDALARETGQSRSRLFAVAMRQYLDRLENQRMLDALNEVHGDPSAEESGPDDTALATAHRRWHRERLKDDEW